MLATLGGVLLALLTVSDTGRLYQPALSGDGRLVAYAAEVEGKVTIYAASTAGGPAWPVVEIGAGAHARRLATIALGHAPFSPDGLSLLCLKPEGEASAGGLVEPNAGLYVYGVEGEARGRVAGPIPTNTGPVSLTDGTIEAATWHRAKGSRAIVLAHRPSPSGPGATRIVMYTPPAGEGDAAEHIEQVAAFDPEEPVHVLQIASSPDGRHIALLTLSGPRDARVRKVQVLDLAESDDAKSLRALPVAGAPNFLAFNASGSHLFYVDTEGQALLSFRMDNGQIDPERAAPDVSFGVPVLDGAFAVVKTPAGAVEAIEFATATRTRLGVGFAPMAAAAGKLALLRTRPPGPAVVIADIDEASLRAGEIGLGEDQTNGAGSGGASEGAAAATAGGASR